MKKYIGIILAALMLVTGTSCSGKSESSEASTSGSSSSEESAELYTLELPDVGQQLVWETDEIKISTEYSKRADPGIKLKIENKTKEKLELRLDELYVNELDLPCFFDTDIEAGATVFDTIEFFRSDLKEANIRKVGRIEFDFILIKENDKNRIVSDPIVIETEYSGEADLLKGPGGEVLYDENGIKIVSVGVSEVVVSGKKLALYYENGTDEEKNIKISCFKVNGIESQLSNYESFCELPAGKRSMKDVYLKDVFEKYDTQLIESIEVEFEVESEDDGNCIKTGTFSVDIN